MQEQSQNLFALKSLPPFSLDLKMRMKTYNLNSIVRELGTKLVTNMTDGIDLRMDLADKELVVMVDSLKIKEAIFNDILPYKHPNGIHFTKSVFFVSGVK